MNGSISAWLEGKDILITGATGFMGKVLVEKLLRCNPGIKRLFLVMRAKRGCDPASRIKTFENELFEPLLKQCPNAFDKLVVIPGDMAELNFGISEEHQKLLMENVSVVFHVAATVRFDESVSDSIKKNVRGTKELIILAKEMKKLEVFEYVSTAYSNPYLKEAVEEKVYPSHLNWRDLVALVDKDDDVLDLLLYKLLGNQPNTYTLTKALSENMVDDLRNELPCVIIRPCIVMPVYRDPVPGWIGSIGGLAGVLAGCGKGVLRVTRFEGNAVLDMVPVDLAVNGMIAAAWFKQFEEKNEVQVCNETSREGNKASIKELFEMACNCNHVYPVENYIWYPFLLCLNNLWCFKLVYLLLHIIPGIFLDLALKVSGAKTMFYTLNIKVYNLLMMLYNVGNKRHSFRNELLQRIHDKMCSVDQHNYMITEAEFERNSYILQVQYGVRRYLFHEKDEDLPKCKKVHRRLYYLHIATKYGALAFVAWKICVWSAFYLNRHLSDYEL